VAEQIATLIILNEDPTNWLEKSTAYVAKPVDQNADRVRGVEDVAFEHNLESYLAGILYASKAWYLKKNFDIYKTKV